MVYRKGSSSEEPPRGLLRVLHLELGRSCARLRSPVRRACSQKPSFPGQRNCPVSPAPAWPALPSLPLC